MAAKVDSVPGRHEAGTDQGRFHLDAVWVRVELVKRARAAPVRDSLFRVDGKDQPERLVLVQVRAPVIVERADFYSLFLSLAYRTKIILSFLLAMGTSCIFIRPFQRDLERNVVKQPVDTIPFKNQIVSSSSHASQAYRLAGYPAGHLDPRRLGYVGRFNRAGKMSISDRSISKKSAGLNIVPKYTIAIENQAA